MATPKWAMDKANSLVKEAKTRYEQAKKQIPAEYHEFIVLLPQNVKIGNKVEIDQHAQGLGMWATEKGTYVPVSYPYMAVNGRVKMARDDHRKHEKLMHFHEPVISENGSFLKITIESDMLGKATGSSIIRTGDKASGAEKDNPLEVAETSAIGRALGFLGYGLIGTGIASAEEMIDEDNHSDEPGSYNGDSSGSGSDKGNSSNAPQPHRIKVTALPSFNQDGTSSFKALTTSMDEITVIVPKIHNTFMKSLKVETVLNLTGWLNNNKLRIANNSEMKREEFGAA